MTKNKKSLRLRLTAAQVRMLRECAADPRGEVRISGRRLAAFDALRSAGLIEQTRARIVDTATTGGRWDIRGRITRRGRNSLRELVAPQID